MHYILLIDISPYIRNLIRPRMLSPVPDAFVNLISFEVSFTSRVEGYDLIYSCSSFMQTVVT